MTWGVIGLAGVLVLIAHAPLVLLNWRRMWGLEHYQYFPFVLGGAAIVARQRLQDGDAPQAGRLLLVVPLWLMSSVLLGIAVLAWSPWLGTVAMMFSMVAVVWTVGGLQLFRTLLPAWLLLWLAVPLPLGLDDQLVLSLQYVATGWASGLLDLVKVRHLVSGVTIEVPGRSYLVEEACSGVHSLFASVSCALFYLMLLNRSVFRSIVMLAATMFWVLVANTARVTLVCFLDSQWNVPVTDGWRHELLGIVMFVLSIGLIVSTDRLLMFFVPIRDTRDENAPRLFPRLHRKRKRARAANQSSASPDEADGTTKRRVPKNLAVAVCVVFSSLILLQIVGPAKAAGLGKAEVSAEPSTRLSRDLLPAQFNGWTQTGFETIQREPDDPNGEYSTVWSWQKNGRHALVSVDGPFIGWHNLANCWTATGWTVAGTHNHEYADADGGYTSIRLSDGTDRFAYVVFGVFDPSGASVKPAETYVGFRAVRRFPKAKALLDRLMGSGADSQDDATTEQIQVYLETYVEPDDATRRDVDELFQAVRRALIERRSGSAQ